MTLNTYQNILNNLPEDWEAKKFSELGQVISGGTPSRDNPAFWHGDIPWLTPGEISSNAVKYLTETEEKISSSGLNGSGANLLPEKSLMITSRATLGARVINTVPMSTNQGFKNVVFYDTDDAGFYYYLLELVKPEMFRRASGTTFLEISSKEFSDIELPVPTKKERMIIEKTFDTLDTSIRQTEAIIAKLQQVKKGLLHDLLTRGIDDSGQLRPPQHLAPELYKESPLGWIPKQWEVKPLNTVIDSIDAGKSPNCPDTPAASGQWGVIKVSAVRYDGFISSENKVVENPLWMQPDYVVHDGDLLITRANTPELIGMVCLVQSPQERLMLSDKTLRINISKKSSNTFIYWAFQQSAIRTQIEVASTGTSMSMKNISQAAIRNLLFAFPEKNEQDLACKQIESIGIRIQEETRKLNKLKKQKSGLMNDLLTGKVRVTSLL